MKSIPGHEVERVKKVAGSGDSGVCLDSIHFNVPKIVHIVQLMIAKLKVLLLKGALYGIEPSTRNGNIWPTRERQQRQYLKISC